MVLGMGEDWGRRGEKRTCVIAHSRNDKHFPPIVGVAYIDNLLCAFHAERCWKVKEESWARNGSGSMTPMGMSVIEGADQRRFCVDV